MKQQKIKYAIRYCILALIWGMFIASLFVSCNVYEKETDTEHSFISSWFQVEEEDVETVSFNSPDRL